MIKYIHIVGIDKIINNIVVNIKDSLIIIFFIILIIIIDIYKIKNNNKKIQGTFT